MKKLLPFGLLLLLGGACSSEPSKTPGSSAGSGGTTGGSAGRASTGGTGGSTGGTGGSTGGTAGSTAGTGGSTGGTGGSTGGAGGTTGGTGGTTGGAGGTGGSTGGTAGTGVAGMTSSGGASTTGGTGGQGGTGTMGGAAGQGTGGSSGGMGGGAGTGSGDMHWVGTWASGQQITEHSGDQMNWPPIPLANATLRQLVHVSIGGSQLRVRVSNEYGTADVGITAVHIAKPTSGGSIDTSTDKALTFGGMPGTTIKQGMATYTDTFDYTLAPLSDLAVTIVFGNQTGEITGHPGSRTTSYMTAGNHVSDATISANATQHWYFLSNVDVMAPASTAAIAILGDSITDGRGSDTDMNDRWPDDLAKRLQATTDMKNIAVLNLGIGGNCVDTGGLGPTAKARFDSQIIAQPGVKWVMVLEGVNDIAGNVSASALTTDFQSFIDKSHKANLKIFGIPILPFAGTTNSGYDSTAHQQVRTDTNTWINAAGHFDAALPLDKTVGDNSNPPKLLTMYDSNDHLHLNAAGYKAMSDAIDLSIFK